MKKIIPIAIFACLTSLSINAIAAEQTVSIGYAQTKVDDFKDIKGVNLQYLYETDSLPVGIVVSTSYMSGKKTERDSISFEDTTVNFDTKAKIKYFSLLAGPSYSFNEYVSAYGLLGFAHTKLNVDAYLSDPQINLSDKESKTSFAYGVGLSLNPIENVAVNVGYEGTHAKYDGDKIKFNGFNIGVGYTF